MMGVSQGFGDIEKSKPLIPSSMASTLKSLTSAALKSVQPLLSKGATR